MNIWKILAIIFIIISIIETILIGWAIITGLQELKNEDICSTQCLERNADSYLYDSYLIYCKCYRNGELMKPEFIKDYGVAK